MRTTILAGATSILAMLGPVAATPLTLPLKHRALASQARLPRHQTRADSSSHNIGLKDYFNRTDNQWYSDISVGTPPQTLSVLWDTGSSALLLPQSNCTTCGTHRLFNPANSSSFTPAPGTFVNPLFSTGPDSIPLQQAEGATCYINQDAVAIGDLQVKSQYLLLCDSYAPILDEQPIDGIIGLDPPNGDSGPQSWFWNLWYGGQLPSAVFAFYTPAGNLDGAELALGGYDQSKFKGDLAWAALSHGESGEPSGWVVDYHAMSISTDKHNTQTPVNLNAAQGDDAGAVGWAVLDTGTAFIQAPDNATAAQIYAQVSPAITPGAPCDVLGRVAPNIQFTLGSGASIVNVTMPASAFNLGEYPGQPGICQAVFNSPSVPIGGGLGSTPIWILGSPLLKAYYTVWDGLGGKIGWGELAG
ncbi:pepsin A1 [Apiospora marii]|uniref:pepsin A1 n=1 Tax=Apiospora marii TaxID=335849 RepID=UPI00312EAE75